MERLCNNGFQTRRYRAVSAPEGLSDPSASKIPLRPISPFCLYFQSLDQFKIGSSFGLQQAYYIMSGIHPHISQHGLPLGIGLKAPMILAICKSYVAEYVKDDNLSAALDLLAELCEIYAPNKKNEVILQKRRLSEVEQRSRTGALNFESVSRRKGEIAEAVLEIADQL